MAPRSAPGGSGTTGWREWLHPRDWRGRFIRAGAHVDISGIGQGRVLETSRDGKTALVRMPKGNKQYIPTDRLSVSEPPAGKIFDKNGYAVGRGDGVFIKLPGESYYASGRIDEINDDGTVSVGLIGGIAEVYKAEDAGVDVKHVDPTLISAEKPEGSQNPVQTGIPETPDAPAPDVAPDVAPPPAPSPAPAPDVGAADIKQYDDAILPSGDTITVDSIIAKGTIAMYHDKTGKRRSIKLSKLKKADASPEASPSVQRTPSPNAPGDALDANGDVINLGDRITTPDGDSGTVTNYEPSTGRITFISDNDKKAHNLDPDKTTKEGGSAPQTPDVDVPAPETAPVDTSSDVVAGDTVTLPNGTDVKVDSIIGKGTIVMYRDDTGKRRSVKLSKVQKSDGAPSSSDIAPAEPKVPGSGAGFVNPKPVKRPRVMPRASRRPIESEIKTKDSGHDDADLKKATRKDVTNALSDLPSSETRTTQVKDPRGRTATRGATSKGYAVSKDTDGKDIVTWSLGSGGARALPEVRKQKTQEGYDSITERLDAAGLAYIPMYNDRGIFLGYKITGKKKDGDSKKVDAPAGAPSADSPVSTPDTVTIGRSWESGSQKEVRVGDVVKGINATANLYGPITKINPKNGLVTYQDQHGKKHTMVPGNLRPVDQITSSDKRRTPPHEPIIDIDGLGRWDAMPAGKGQLDIGDTVIEANDISGKSTVVKKYPDGRITFRNNNTGRTGTVSHKSLRKIVPHSDTGATADNESDVPHDPLVDEPTPRDVPVNPNDIFRPGSSPMTPDGEKGLSSLGGFAKGQMILAELDGDYAVSPMRVAKPGPGGMIYAEPIVSSEVVGKHGTLLVNPSKAMREDLYFPDVAAAPNAEQSLAGLDSARIDYTTMSFTQHEQDVYKKLVLDDDALAFKASDRTRVSKLKYKGLASIAAELGMSHEDFVTAYDRLNELLDIWSMAGGRTNARDDMEAAMKHLRSGGKATTDAERAMLLQKAWADAAWNSKYGTDTTSIPLVRYVQSDYAVMIHAENMVNEHNGDKKTGRYTVEQWPLSSWADKPAAKKVKDEFIGRSTYSVKLERQVTRDEVWLNYLAEPLFRSNVLRAPGEMIVDDRGGPTPPGFKVTVPETKKVDKLVARRIDVMARTLADVPGSKPQDIASARYLMQRTSPEVKPLFEDLLGIDIPDADTDAGDDVYKNFVKAIVDEKLTAHDVQSLDSELESTMGYLRTTGESFPDDKSTALRIHTISEELKNIGVNMSDDDVKKFMYDATGLTTVVQQTDTFLQNHSELTMDDVYTARILTHLDAAAGGGFASTKLPGELTRVLGVNVPDALGDGRFADRMLPEYLIEWAHAHDISPAQMRSFIESFNTFVSAKTYYNDSSTSLKARYMTRMQDALPTINDLLDRLGSDERVELPE